MRTKQAIWITAILVALGCTEGFTQQTLEFEQLITGVVVNTDLGHVTVLGMDEGDTSSAEVVLDCKNSMPKYNLVLENSILVFEMAVPQGAHACDALITLRVPSDTAIDIRTGRGDVILSQLDGDVSVVNYDGNVDLALVSGTLKITTVSGDVTGTSMKSSDAEFTLGNGNTNLRYVTAPRVVDVDILSGDSTLMVPDATYEVEVGAKEGEIEMNSISTDENATHMLVAYTDKGNIRIQGGM